MTAFQICFVVGVIGFMVFEGIAIAMLTYKVRNIEHKAGRRANGYYRESD